MKQAYSQLCWLIKTVDGDTFLVTRYNGVYSRLLHFCVPFVPVTSGV